jgi:hypothetical protein
MSLAGARLHELERLAEATEQTRAAATLLAHLAHDGFLGVSAPSMPPPGRNHSPSSSTSATRPAESITTA